MANLKTIKNDELLQNFKQLILIIDTLYET